MAHEEDRLSGFDATEVSGDATEESRAAKKVLTPAAQRALAEAAQRRASAQEPAMDKELGGRKEGPEPTRYGDWESKGLISDF